LRFAIDLPSPAMTGLGTGLATENPLIEFHLR
jgi:hypothetical protein